MAYRYDSGLIRSNDQGPISTVSSFGHRLSPEHERQLAAARREMLRRTLERHERRKRERGRPDA